MGLCPCAKVYRLVTLEHEVVHRRCHINMKRLLAFLSIVLLSGAVLTAHAQEAQTLDDEQISQLQRIATSLFSPLPEVAENPENELTDTKVLLGKMLYYDPRLSKSGFISCNSCHNLATYGVDNLSTSLGHMWAVGPRNAPTVLNAALHQAGQFWDGRAKDVEEQAGGPPLNPIEMGLPHADFGVDRIASMPQYVEMFEQAFPGDEDTLTFENIANAIGAFERTLMTPDRFDTFLEGDTAALNNDELLGLQAFVTLGCAGCHNGAALGGNTLARFGVVESYWEATREVVTLTTPTQPLDVGKFSVTHDQSDLYVFKVPSLRNITRTYPYFHDGSVWDLRDATQVMARVQLGRELDEDTVDNLMAFYDTLQGEIPTFALTLPVLPASTQQTSQPEFR